MSLRTLHKDSCLNLQALAETNESASEKLYEENQKENCNESDSDSDTFENNDSSKIIDINLVGKGQTEDLVETSVSSDEGDAPQHENEKHVAKKHKNPNKSITGILPWFKNKNGKKGTSNPKSAKRKSEEPNTTKDELDKTHRRPSQIQEGEDNVAKIEQALSANMKEEKKLSQRNLKRLISTDSEEAEHDPVCSTPKSIMTRETRKAKKNVRFAATARLITIFPHKNLPLSLKHQIWWQRTDYRNFKKTIDIITRELLQHASNEVWFLGAEDNRYATPDVVSKENEFGLKWWCQYGHSRRGLEHIVSTEEGRFRQRNVEKAMAAILTEQRHQNKENKRDPRKLGMAAAPYNAFARDLSQAIGRSDAQAVQVNFDSSKTKGFRHFLPSKYDEGFFEWERASLKRTLQSKDSTSDLFALAQEGNDSEGSMSELDLFSEESNFFG